MRLPLRLRLTLVFSIGMAIVLLGLGTFAYVRVSADLLASVDAGLQSRAQVLADAVARVDARNVVTAKGKLIDPDEAFAQILDASGKLIEASSAVSDAPLLSAAELRSVTAPTFLTRKLNPPDDPVRLLAVGVNGSPLRIVVVGATLGDVTEAIQRFLLVMATIGPLAVLLTAGAGWLLATAALRPVERMRGEAAAVSASEPTRRLPVPQTGDELARLATTLNAMLDRLQEALEREHRFVDDASHELRTPLATLRAGIDLALTRRRDIPELEAALRSAQEDVQRLQRLADDLLLLARTRGGRIPVHRVETSLGALATRSVRYVEGQAAAAGVTIDVEPSHETVAVDPDRMEQALRNLLENAIRYTPPGGVVRISARRLPRFARFVVADNGPGFRADVLSKAFEPFTRGEAETARPTGAGLGLSIVRAVAEAHGGSASAENTPDGARVTLDVRI
ncbi:MAG: ATP-binding protein [Candidatus Dormibacteraeota bacterium]|nr:ATP-binding protein [Candidatus Dormibacteraeota bacterium]